MAEPLFCIGDKAIYEGKECEIICVLPNSIYAQELEIVAMYQIGIYMPGTTIIDSYKFVKEYKLQPIGSGH